ncbi:MAG: hypothetical protein GF393_05525 [Armatimonadia bacterium]|nr:hypothetical protein [Armatimonadia bacterium]
MSPLRRKLFIAVATALVVAYVAVIYLGRRSMWDVAPWPWEVSGGAELARSWGYPLARVIGDWEGSERYAQQYASRFRACYWEEPSEEEARNLLQQLIEGWVVPYAHGGVEYLPGTPSGASIGDESFYLLDAEWGARLVVRSGRYVAFAYSGGLKETAGPHPDREADLAAMIDALSVFAERAE